MSLEWFDRIGGELQDHLISICDEYDRKGSMVVERGSKHPRIEFYTEADEHERDYFASVFFDPHNEEFYLETFDPELGQVNKVVLADIEDIVDAVHESLHDYMKENDTEYEYDLDDDVLEENDGAEIYEIDVDWETPEVTAYMKENEVEVTYQFGIVQETGDGVLKRINRIRTANDDLLKDETNFIFSKEEASTIIAMIASHMDKLSEME